MKQQPINVPAPSNKLWWEHFMDGIYSGLTFEESLSHAWKMVHSEDGEICEHY